MTRLLVAGVGPRPASSASAVFAPGLRLQTVAGELARHAHDVEILEYTFGGEAYKEGPPPEAVRAVHPLPSGETEARATLDHCVETFRPDAVVALTDWVAWLVATSDWEGPLYVDYNGHPMAERQMSSFVHENDDGLLEQWRFLLPVLLRADRFATCSGTQRLALIGELGAVGRMNAATCGHDLVDVLRPPVTFSEPFAPSEDAPYLRGTRVPEDARIMLFTGGYNTWLDEEMLFAAVERVLEADPRAVYVSTGGAIASHVTRVFERFRELVERSPHRERYCFVGWLEHRHYVDCCLEADVGLFSDRWTLEGELGFRNRIFGWAWAGMRTVATDLCEEVREEFVPLGIVEPVACGDVEGFANALLGTLEKGRLSPEEAERQREAILQRCSPAREYEALVRWAADPRVAPDRAGGGRASNSLAALHAEALAAAPAGEDMKELLERLEGSRAFRLWASGQPRVRELIEKLRAT